jgi:hypothetical protein
MPPPTPSWHPVGDERAAFVADSVTGMWLGRATSFTRTVPTQYGRSVAELCTGCTLRGTIWARLLDRHAMPGTLGWEEQGSVRR